jgi:hypothetical protein
MIRQQSTAYGLLLAAVLISAETASSAAQGRWPADYDSSIHFYSTDTSPIEVRLGEAILHIPRAAIIFADGYTPTQMSRLPDTVDTREIAIVVVYPDGEPLSSYAHDLANNKRISEAAAIRSLRSRQYYVSLHYAKPSQIWEENMYKHLSRLPTTDYYDGLRHTGSDDYIAERGVDAFVEVHCYPEAKPETYCNTAMRIGEALRADARFPDFRFHGGRTYQNERARKLKEIVCHYVASGCG